MYLHKKCRACYYMLVCCFCLTRLNFILIEKLVKIYKYKGSAFAIKYCKLEKIR